ncbi:NAD(P)H-binding protein [Williamsia sp.]|uniref:NAD(P)H-binding protein n=1 Tax=Williamsia sp. TaxID=1872085 RepID=UPI002F94F465
MKIAVLGANGAVGARIVEKLSGRGHEVVRVGRNPASNDVVVDLGASGGAAYREAIDGMDVVVNASGIEDPALAKEAGTARFVDISATPRYLEKIMAAPAAGGVLTCVGLAPGLTTIMATALAADSSDGVDIGLMLGAGERHGRAAVEWTAGLLGATFTDYATGVKIRNLVGSRVLEGPHGSRKRYMRTDFPDHLAIGADGPHVANYLTMSSVSATLALRMAALVPSVGRPLMRKIHPGGSDEWSVLVRNRNTGRWLYTSGHNQSAATATITVAAIEAAQGRIDPVLLSCDVLDTNALHLHWDIMIRSGR